MKIGLICATSKELEAILPGASKYESIKFFGHEFYCLYSGIGLINAGISTANLLAKFSNLDFVLNAGIAGSFNLKVAPLGFSCLVKKEIWPEFGLYTQQGIDARALGFPIYKSKNKLIFEQIDLSTENNIADCVLNFDNFSIVNSLSVSGVTGTFERARFLHAKYGITIENMEGFGVALACLQRNIPIYEIRTISNLVGSRDKKDWDIGLALNSLNSILSRIFI